MKKLLIFVLALALLLSACSSTKYPMTEQHEKWGRKALEIADAYLDFEMSLEEAHKKISELYDAADSLPKGTEDEQFGNTLVGSNMLSLDFAFFNANLRAKGLTGLASKESADILKARNSLAEILGVKAR